MHHAFHPALSAAVLSLLLMQNATAQVYQCLDGSGKKVFSQLPCAAQGGNSEKLLLRAPAAAPAATAPADGMPVRGEPGVLYGNGGAASAPRDWAAENAAANARAAAADQAVSNRSRHVMPPNLGGMQKPMPASPGITDKQIIANCEANHGARCSSPGEIAQRRMEQRELSPSERQQQQRAVADRLQREREEAFQRSMRR